MVRALADIERAISAIAAQPNSGIIVQPDGYTLSNRRFIIELAARYRLPTIHDRRIEAAEGGLASYGADLLDLIVAPRPMSIGSSRAKVLQTCRYSNRSSMSWW
jgi:hypothetical protein